MKKNQYFSRVRSTSENADIFTVRDEMERVVRCSGSRLSPQLGFVW